MSDGREEREELEKRREQEKRENREDQIDRGVLDEWEPERRAFGERSSPSLAYRYAHPPSLASPPETCATRAQRLSGRCSVGSLRFRAWMVSA